MFFLRDRKKVLLLAALTFTLVVLTSIPTLAQQQVQYAAKFLCGVPGIEAEREAVKPGNYATAINVHNPLLTAGVEFRKKAVRALPQGFEPIPPSQFRPEGIGPNFALEIDCQNIRDLLGGPPAPEFIKGFLVILSPIELDVVAVYTGQPPGQTGGMTMDVETIQPRRLVVPASTKNKR